MWFRWFVELEQSSRQFWQRRIRGAILSGWWRLVPSIGLGKGRGVATRAIRPIGMAERGVRRRLLGRYSPWLSKIDVDAENWFVSCFSIHVSNPNRETLSHA